MLAVADTPVRDWLVAGALIEGPAGLLLVQNRRRNGSLDWSPPGGVIDDGETVAEGLAREVAEETGLVVTDWIGPRYEIAAEAPGLGWRLRVEVWAAASYAGELRVADPDGIVVAARFVDLIECRACLESNHPWVREPLVAWLDDRWNDSRRFEYRIDGTSLASLVVTRV